MQVRRTATRGLVAAAAVALALSACTTKGETTADDTASGGTGGAGTVKVALVPGGSHPYFQPWKPAGEKAVTDFKLGGTTFNETAEWDQTKQNEVLNSLAAQGYNAFGIFGVSPTDINTTFKTLKDQGFAVGSLASCPAGDTNEADFCLSTDTEVAAYKAAKAAIEAMGGKGNLVHLTGNNVDANTQRRIAGVKKAVDETNGSVTLLTTVTDIDKDLSTAQKAVADLLASKGSDINGFVSTAYNPAVASASAVKASGLPIKVVAIDDDKVILDGIKDGSVSATVVQNPTGQAYVGSYVLAQLQTKACTMKDPGVVVDSGSFVVTKPNVDTYDAERQKESDKILDQFKNELLSCK
ncbi:substrate-binding domain-containing protein [Cellulomonas sp. URHD0024]|uniref:substrate-binding domain-containing protein n=1 Tax=Cellulomonas sp. URHD0024 TaxID=1302620 RepID=UPI0004077373|nr:substrate-binding domain-containing protein [Cellulomonas sp. URHD0024]